MRPIPPVEQNLICHPAFQFLQKSQVLIKGFWKNFERRKYRKPALSLFSEVFFPSFQKNVFSFVAYNALCWQSLKNMMTDTDKEKNHLNNHTILPKV